MTPRDLSEGVDRLEQQFAASGQQLSVLESLLFNRALDKNATPSRMPIMGSYITSGFGGRADPSAVAGQYHKGIDFKANVGDPVLAVADGVVAFAGVKGGYGYVVDVDHGNGYVTRYAHNSRLAVREGDLVRVGQEVAKAGSTGARPARTCISRCGRTDAWSTRAVPRRRSHAGGQRRPRLSACGRPPALAGRPMHPSYG
jgi:murein DD-endopeptidase MepM/ murein hydrolase activator NlpD